MSAKTRGVCENSAAAIISRVASTWARSFSYSASSRTSAKINPCPRHAPRGWRGSHRYLGLDMRMRIVAFEHEIFVTEREQILHRRIDTHSRQRARGTRKLQAGLLEMIEIKMRVAEGVDEVAWLEIGDLRHHHRQQRVRGDVERHAEKYIGGA